MQSNLKIFLLFIFEIPTLIKPVAKRFQQQNIELPLSHSLYTTLESASLHRIQHTCENPKKTYKNYHRQETIM